MLVQAFFEWTATANAKERAEAATTLAQAYLDGALGGDTVEDVEVALMSVLDDSSPMVRRALAMALAEAEKAPRALVLSLARDQAEVSGLLLARSPLITDADLMDLASHAERLALSAIALRMHVSARVAGAIVLRAERDPIHSLLKNRGAEIAAGHLVDIASQFGQDAAMRETLLARSDLPPEARHILMRAVAETLGDFLGKGGFLTPQRLARATSEALEGGIVAIAGRSTQDLPVFVEHLRNRAELTPSLLLRAVLMGAVDFVTATLAELTELPAQRVEHLVAGGTEAGIGALVRKAGLPEFLTPVLVSALLAAVRLPQSERGQGLNMGVIRAAQSAIIGTDSEESLRLLALLRRYEADAARAAARALAETLRAKLSTPVLPALTSGELGAEMLRLSSFDGDQAVAWDEEDADLLMDVGEEAKPAPAPAPDLASLIAEWKAEHAARDSEAMARLVNDAGSAQQQKAA
ncbi:MAG: DUF2336 domain-containing protein [Proteobacteria bacterium]|nr:DUF2336 domain-containing protein [Pseudomonadota bacterium]